MNLKYIISAFTAISILMGGEQVMAQKSHYSFERIESVTPWLQSANGAGLVFNAADENISTVYGYGDYQDNCFKNYNQAESETMLGLGTKSYTKLNNFYFYGKFEYNYAVKKNQTWLGTVYENSTFAPIVENVPGRVLRESYNLNAKIAYKVSDKSAFGISFDYEDATAAKQKDGRNSNVYSNLNVSTAYTFASEYVNFGIGLNYRFKSEKVNYQYYGEAIGHELYYMEGLFLYTSSTITNTVMKDRMYTTNTFGGSAQLELKYGKWSFYNQFKALYGSQDLYEDLGLKKRYAFTDNLLYAYNGILKLNGNKMENSLHLNYANDESLLYNITNVYEPIEGENNQWQYNEHGKSLRYTNKKESCGAMYHGFIKRDEYLQNVDFTIGFSFMQEKHTHKLYPSVYYQALCMRNYFASVNKSLLVKENGYFLIGLAAGFYNANGEMLYQTNPITSGSIKMHTDLLETDYIYRIADKYNVGGSIKYSHTLNKDKGMSLWVKASYNYNGVKIPEYNSENVEAVSHFVKDCRHAANVTVGFNF